LKWSPISGPDGKLQIGNPHSDKPRRHAEDETAGVIALEAGREMIRAWKKLLLEQAARPFGSGPGWT
jgi:hypothetical protein